jgi:cytoskeleton protein RodZ
MAVFGDTLRQARAHKGVTLKEAEQATRINRHHLLALEEEKFDELPPLIYQRGIVRNYANYLNLDPSRLLQMFETSRGVSPDDQPMVIQAHPDVPTHWAPNFAVIAFLVVMSAVVFAWMYSAYFAPSDETTPPTEVIPTVTQVTTDTIFLPTSTSSPTLTPSPTAEPTSEPTPEPIEDIVEPDQTEPSANEPDVVATDETEVLDDVQEPVQEAQTPESDGALTFNFRATNDLESVQIVADGSVVFDGYLASGESTGYVSADQFQVYVADPSSLEVVRENGDSFYMGDTYFELP